MKLYAIYKTAYLYKNRAALPDGTEITLHGRIDRIDRYDTPEASYRRVVDYKSGSNATLDAAEHTLLASRERPIVLLPMQPGCQAALPGVAPGLQRLGVMLPSTPIHYLLCHEAAGQPYGIGWLDEPQPLVLVMTSLARRRRRVLVRWVSR